LENSSESGYNWGNLPEEVLHTPVETENVDEAYAGSILMIYQVFFITAQVSLSICRVEFLINLEP